MQQSLSQADIDALMKSLLPAGDDLFNSGGSVVKPYDFRRPTKFKKEVLRTLLMIHDNYARQLQSVMSAHLRLQARVHVRGTAQYSYTEFVQLLPTPAVVCLFRMDPLPGMCLVDISPNLAFAIVEGVFGGGGDDEQPQRSLSEIETAVVHRALTEMMRPLKDAWLTVTECQPELGPMETNPQFLKVATSSDVVVVITLAIEIGEHIGHMQLALPHTTVDPVLSRLTASWLVQAGQQEMGDASNSGPSIGFAPVDVEVFLGSMRLPVSEFLQVREGDLLVLPVPVDTLAEVRVEGRPVLRGRPGLVGNRLSIQVDGESGGVHES